MFDGCTPFPPGLPFIPPAGLSFIGDAKGSPQARTHSGGILARMSFQLECNYRVAQFLHERHGRLTSADHLPEC